jgi:hypothetical protein
MRQSLEVMPQMTSPIMARIAAAIMKGALALRLLESHTVAQIDKLASAFGGIVILKVGIRFVSTLFRWVGRVPNELTTVPAMS